MSNACLIHLTTTGQINNYQDHSLDTTDATEYTMPCDLSL